ncbi:putative mannose-6-phosphate isomerase/mannose-1-phosphate guanylyl transferase [Caenibius tardaugens NBRC 16725]|uniref:Putative mannose-6-phosphate isomerase/mannose-1-phosphate guanylyl transferase n=1 Tax=Caenibius tardaugens NBRC 16725 TaxID=1219035 RepID=U2YPB6_9SPHN|nr:sugar phosphate nucleotidyltransferase [Caenibius tardaugens]AZI38260.1 mannose-1-phosphate guanylyltransferase [Caenibius tardaugens NBRC 16725]GAD50760.1 putative mannose-6-phosphate isomerase/mannose-1-phosphate guanylyl transferase [Caenibius tardaugens NBRC 16725]
MMGIVPVVLCGGGGTRLWPRSRLSRPKPFLPLLDDNSTPFAATLARCADDTLFAPPLIVAGAAHLHHVEAETSQISGAQVIVEPAMRNTAAAIALAAHRLDRDAVMLVCPSDHFIADTDAFRRAARDAATLASEGWLVAFGIAPGEPETGYGYIRQGEPLGAGYRIDRFVEKPDKARAEAFLAEGTYYWNGGLFAFTAGTYLDELAMHRPALAAAVGEAVAQGQADGAHFHADPDAFARIESESIDYAVMENTTRAAMVRVDMGWSDIGNWKSLQAARRHDADGNTVRGTAELIGCRNVMVDSDGPRVSVIGLENVVIVIDGDDILVTSAEGAQRVGTLQGATPA